ncbi:MAG: pseudouridine synthase [Candidatus Omnitrophota bacterium]
MNPGLKLQLFLSHSGVCSRRKALDLILDGHVTVNAQVMQEPSLIINPEKDKISLDGKLIQQKTYTYLLLNKPRGFVTTLKDKHAQKTVLDLLPQDLRYLRPAGRLDKDTEGLLLLTNDGDLIYKLTHPKFNIDKTYFVQINGELKATEKKQLETGVKIDGKITSPAKIFDIKIKGKKSEFQIVIHEGRKRQIRRMLDCIGHKVVYLKRIEQGQLRLGDLAIGKWRYLSEKEVSLLKDKSFVDK